MEYDDMLDRALEQTANLGDGGGRFSPPEPEIQEDGAFTIYKNFRATAKYMNREVPELLTFFKDELATNASLDASERARFKGEFDLSDLNSALDEYLDGFVLCEQCSSPDTHYEELQGVEVIRCDACGATAPKPSL